MSACVSLAPSTHRPTRREIAHAQRNHRRAVVETPPGGRDGVVRQLPSFRGHRCTSTVAYLVLYALLREVDRPVRGQHRRARRHGDRQHGGKPALHVRRPRRRCRGPVGAPGQGGVAFLIGLALTNGALLVLHSVSRSPRHTVEIAVLIVANLLATASRFLLMRVWVFKTA